MQRVSRAYQESMKSSLRERAYIMLSFGLVNREIQAKARVEEGDCTYYSNAKNIFHGKKDDTVYATLEENFTKVDGSMFFLPRRNESNAYLDTGIVSEKLVSDSIFELQINLNVPAIDFKGITINFGENYPVDFDLLSSSGQVIEFRNNTESLFSSEEVLEDTTEIRLIVYRMKNPRSRVRIYSIRFGYGLVYYNNDVMGSTLESYISPIGADVPQIDFTVKLKNYDRYFDVDNPDSAINFFETGQEMEIQYGYQLPDSDEIEWVQGNRLLCAEWESDDYTATIRCHDIFRNMDSEFYKGKYRHEKRSYYDLAVEVLEDAGHVLYSLSPRLKRLYTNNPLPRVQHKEALQIIANACGCILSQTRDGVPQIKPSLDLHTPWEIEATYVSPSLSEVTGKFNTNPIFSASRSEVDAHQGMTLVFGEFVPTEFIVRTYHGEVLVTEQTLKGDAISRETVIDEEFDDFDKVEVEFVRTAEPYQPANLVSIVFGNTIDFTMTRTDMTSSPKAIKQELVKEIVVPYYRYQSGTVEETLLSEEITVQEGDEETFFLGEAAYDFRVALEENPDGVTILDWGNYYVKVQFHLTGTFRLEIFGVRYKVVEAYATKTLNARGKTIKWENPLVSDAEMAKNLAEWLGDYYSSGVEYEYNTRGNPELDVNDVIYQENDFRSEMKVNMYRQTLHFNQTFSGSVTTRRIGG